MGSKNFLDNPQSLNLISLSFPWDILPTIPAPNREDIAVVVGTRAYVHLCLLLEEMPLVPDFLRPFNLAVPPLGLG